MVKFRLFGRETDEISTRELEHRSLARKVASEGMVLLKNDNVLPLKSKVISLFGAGARMTIKGGTGSGDMQERYSVNIDEGLKNAGFEIINTRWLDRYDKSYEDKKEQWRQGNEKRLKDYRPWQIQKMFNEVIHVTPFPFPEGDKIQAEDIDTKADAAVYVIARQAGESVDRRLEPGDYLLSDTEVYNIKTLAEQYDKFLLVINCGGMLDLSALSKVENIGAILYFVQAGEEGGNAFADIVVGKISPTGKLTDTWAKRYEDYPSAMEFGYLNGNLKDEDYKEGIYVGYRYFDSFGIKPLFEFGYGLSYTDFSYHTTDISIDGTCISLKAVVKNIGSIYSGKEVLQLYLSKPKGRLNKELLSLAAFAKTKLLKSDESCEIVLKFDLKDHASYDMQSAQWILDAGEYGLHLGVSSRQNKPIAILLLDKKVATEKCINICPMKYSFDEMQAQLPQQVYEDNLPRFEIDAQAIHCVEHSYENPKIKASMRSKRILSTLKDEDFIELCVGAGYTGKSYNNTPGCAGRTTISLLKKGIPNVNFSDGPAGLNLHAKLVVLKSGSMRYMDGIPEIWRWGWLKKIERFIMAKPGQGRAVYQYMTAWPAALLQAQTWNTNLIEQVGKAVGVEMLETGVSLWLAPGMNIHRNPLCGRNFEYYSEDPLITGSMAAAVSMGVQSHNGVGVTVKHYCCNNQEDEREYVSANVSERALREIYLKGFGYTIKKAKPKAVMSSYNLVNGVYTANSHDLLIKVLRSEWNYDGLTMTDWNAADTGKAEQLLCPASGTDLMMPGNKGVKKALKKGIRDGLVLPHDVKRSAVNVLNMIMESSTTEDF